MTGGQTPASPARGRTLTAATAFATDVACVLVFAAAGRRSHDEGVTLGGVVQTAWPFIVGAGLGWLLSRGWRAPRALLPTGVAVWLSAVVFGMLLRTITGAGTARAFIVVACAVTAALLLGWRALALAVGRRG